MTDEVTELPSRLNPLPIEAKWEAQEKRKARKVFASLFSPFVTAMREGIDAYLDYRRRGVSREDSIRGLEAVLRDAWPKGVSKFSATCDTCDDTGYEEHVCQPRVRCGSKHCERRGAEHQHTYVWPCSCAKGQSYARAAARRNNPEQQTEQIGKVSKKRGSWNRMGT